MEGEMTYLDPEELEKARADFQKALEDKPSDEPKVEPEKITAEQPKEEPPSQDPAPEAAKDSKPKKGDLNEALRLEREARAKERQEFEQRQQAMQQQLEQLTKQQSEWGKLFEPELTDEQKQAQAIQEYLAKTAQEVVSPQLAELQKSIAYQNAVLQRMEIERRYPDYHDVVGYGDPDHPFQEYFRNNPAVQGQVSAAQNQAEALYQAAKYFQVSRPEVLQQTVEQKAKALFGEWVKTAGSKMGADPTAAGGLTSMQGSSQDEELPGIDSIDWSSLTPEQAHSLFSKFEQRIYGG